MKSRFALPPRAPQNTMFEQIVERKSTSAAGYEKTTVSDLPRRSTSQGLHLQVLRFRGHRRGHLFQDLECDSRRGRRGRGRCDHAHGKIPSYVQGVDCDKRGFVLQRP